MRNIVPLSDLSDSQKRFLIEYIDNDIQSMYRKEYNLSDISKRIYCNQSIILIPNR